MTGKYVLRFRIPACFGTGEFGMTTIMNLNKDRYLVAIGVAVILMIGIFIRGYQLGNLPNGLTWDEVAIGYNGRAVMQIHRDEWLEFMPLTFKSFGDYKAPVAIYITGFFTTLFGISPLSIRLPFFMAGIISMFSFVWLCWELLHFQKEKKSSSQKKLTLLTSALLISFSPWHILFSRVGFESGMALAQILLGSSLMFSAIRTKRVWLSTAMWLASIFLFVIAPYTYHSSKLVAPLLFFFLIFILLWSKKISIKSGVISLAIFLIGLTPLVYLSIFGQALERAGVTIFAYGLSWQTLELLGRGVIAHLNPMFLLFGETDSLRHSTGQLGVLSRPSLILAVLGSIAGIRQVVRNRHSQKKWRWQWWLVISIGWTVIGLLPAVIGTEVPHPNRALLALPGFLSMAVLGTVIISDWLTQQKQIKSKYLCWQTLIVVILILEMMCLSRFTYHYFGQYQQMIGDDFLTGYWQAARLAYDYSIGQNQSSVNQVLFSSKYGQPYIYVLAANNMDPIAFHNGALVKFLFPDQITVGDLQRDNTLLVATKFDQLEEVEPVQIITDQFGQPRFYFYLVNNKQ